jgi:hypothetical protein
MDIGRSRCFIAIVVPSHERRQLRVMEVAPMAHRAIQTTDPGGRSRPPSTATGGMIAGSVTGQN